MKRRIATSAYPTVPYQPASENRDLTLGWWNPAAFRKRPVYREQVRDTVLLLRLSSYSLSLSLFLSFFLSFFLSHRGFSALSQDEGGACVQRACIQLVHARTNARTHSHVRRVTHRTAFAANNYVGDFSVAVLLSLSFFLSLFFSFTCSFSFARSFLSIPSSRFSF